MTEIKSANENKKGVKEVVKFSLLASFLFTASMLLLLLFSWYVFNRPNKDSYTIPIESVGVTPGVYDLVDYEIRFKDENGEMTSDRIFSKHVKVIFDATDEPWCTFSTSGKLKTVRYVELHLQPGTEISLPED